MIQLRFRALVCLLAALILLFNPVWGAVDVPMAQPKAGKTFTPPLSTRIPNEVSELPNFGRIRWKATLLPWVGEGPNEGISGMGMVTIGGRIYLVGGFIPGSDGTDDHTSNRTSRWCWRYDPASTQWQRMADAPIRREYVRAIAAEGKLYLAGGGCQYKDQEPAYRVHGECAVYTPSDEDGGSWKTIAPLNVPRSHMAVGYAGGQVIVAGGNAYDASENGYSHKTIQGATEAFTPTSPNRAWQMKAALPGAPRGWSASLVNQGHLFLFGGITWRDDNAIVATQETLRYDPKSDNWTHLTPPPLPISGWESACYRDRFAIAVGGVVRPAPDTTESVIWSDMAFAYDTQEDQWMGIDGRLTPGAVFNDPGVVILGDTIYVIGAEGPDGSHYNYFLIGTIERAPTNTPSE